MAPPRNLCFNGRHAGGRQARCGACRLCREEAKHLLEHCFACIGWHCTLCRKRANYMSSQAIMSEARALAIHAPAFLRLTKRCSYCLGLHCRYSVHLMLSSRFLHWLGSQSFFALYIYHFSIGGFQYENDLDLSSTLSGEAVLSAASVTLLSIGFSLLLIQIAVGFRRFDAGLMLSGRQLLRRHLRRLSSPIPWIWIQRHALLGGVSWTLGTSGPALKPRWWIQHNI